MKKHILIVEDEADIASALSARLLNEGFVITVADNGDDGFDISLEENFDLAIIDVMLPGKNGLEIAQSLRENKDTAILVLSARDDEDDIISGLSIGADDYVTKPFSIREVVARVHALLRRREELAKPTRTHKVDSFTFGSLSIDGEKHTVAIDGKIIHTTPTEFRLLGALCSQPGIVFTREDLVELLTPLDNQSDSISHHTNVRTVDSHVRSLRKKIGSHYIRTVHAVGYSFEPDFTSTKVSA